MEVDFITCISVEPTFSQTGDIHQKIRFIPFDYENDLDLELLLRQSLSSILQKIRETEPDQTDLHTEGGGGLSDTEEPTDHPKKQSRKQANGSNHRRVSTSMNPSRRKKQRNNYNRNRKQEREDFKTESVVDPLKGDYGDDLQSIQPSISETGIENTQHEKTVFSTDPDTTSTYLRPTKAIIPQQNRRRRQQIPKKPRIPRNRLHNPRLESDQDMFVLYSSTMGTQTYPDAIHTSTNQQELDVNVSIMDRPKTNTYLETNQKTQNTPFVHFYTGELNSEMIIENNNTNSENLTMHDLVSSSLSSLQTQSLPPPLQSPRPQQSPQSPQSLSQQSTTEATPQPFLQSQSQYQDETQCSQQQLQHQEQTRVYQQSRAVNRFGFPIQMIAHTNKRSSYQYVHKTDNNNNEMFYHTQQEQQPLHTYEMYDNRPIKQRRIVTTNRSANSRNNRPRKQTLTPSIRKEPKLYFSDMILNNRGRKQNVLLYGNLHPIFDAYVTAQKQQKQLLLQQQQQKPSLLSCPNIQQPTQISDPVSSRQASEAMINMVQADQRMNIRTCLRELREYVYTYKQRPHPEFTFSTKMTFLEFAFRYTRLRIFRQKVQQDKNRIKTLYNQQQRQQKRQCILPISSVSYITAIKTASSSPSLSSPETSLKSSSPPPPIITQSDKVDDQATLTTTSSIEILPVAQK